MSTEIEELDVWKNKIALKWGQGTTSPTLCLGSDTVWALKEKETDEGPEKLKEEKLTGQEYLITDIQLTFLHFTLSHLILTLTDVTIFYHPIFSLLSPKEINP